MPARKLLKTVFDPTNRSGFHKIVVPARYRCRAPEAAFDLLGGAIVIGLSVGVAFFVRHILTD